MKAGLVKNDQLFRYFAAYHGVDQDLKAGVYIFEAGDWSLEKVCEQLIAGGYSGEEITVTIVEGKTVEETIQILVDAGLGTVAGYEEYIANADFSKYPYIPDAAVAPASRVEGFLFPDTYNFEVGATEQEVIDKLLNQFNYVWTINEFDVAAQKRGWDVYQMVIMASIIEMEAGNDEDRGLIASVFYNRLDQNIKLESCATVQFLLEEKRDILLNSDTKIESPYNTYMNAGLPVGPIAAPGLASLYAACYPEESDYLFFRARLDGTTRFSTTFEEHDTYHEGDQI